MMKAISLWQPWATMIALGLKQFETRHWSTPYRGPLAIHAAKRWTKEQKEFTEFLLTDPVIGLVMREHGYTQIDQLPLGGIVCTVNLNRIISTHEAVKTNNADAIERMLGDYTAGRYAWLLLNLKRLPVMVPCGGQQGLWQLDSSVLTERAWRREVEGAMVTT